MPFRHGPFSFSCSGNRSKQARSQAGMKGVCKGVNWLTSGAFRDPEVASQGRPYYLISPKKRRITPGSAEKGRPLRESRLGREDVITRPDCLARLLGPDQDAEEDGAVHSASVLFRLPAGLIRVRKSAYGQKTVRRAKACIFSGWESRPATVVPAGSSRSGDGGNEIVGAFDATGRLWRLSE
jgi:hypothetical protein